MRIVLLFLAVLAGSRALQDQEDEVNYRLPLEVKPNRYDIRIEPNFIENIFTGTVIITATALKNASTITLHQYQLIMPSEKLIQVEDIKSARQVQVKAAEDTGTSLQQFFTISLDESLVIGNEYKITIPNYMGALTTDPVGFYLAKYQDENGYNKTFATTHFEPAGARRAFPCFDEPALKARFTLRIARPRAYHSVANTVVDKSASDLYLDVYKESDLMSTYLVAFIVSEMALTETVGRNRILAKPEDVNNGNYDYSLVKSEKVLKAMEEYTQIPYAFEKLDHAAIPRGYYSVGAMENWGLITYLEDALLVATDNISYNDKHQALTILGHEIAHQWFGNLVGPDWWDVIWLNEGFANYFEYYSADKAAPSYDIGRQILTSSVHGALDYDGNDFTRPMTSPATDPDQIFSLFDTIAYSKSASVLRMLEHAVTPPVFRQGLINYLNDCKFKAAVPKNLYENVQKAVDAASLSVNVSEFIESWEFTAGAPVITVTRKYDGTNTVLLTQKRFKNDLSNGPASNWIIPVNFAIDNLSFNNTAPDAWLSKDEDVLNISGLDNNTWLIVNKQQTGYYRVNYDLTNWNLITQALLINHQQIHPFNRAQLIDDCAAFLLSGSISVFTCLDLFEYISNEEDAIPLGAFETNIGSIYSRFYNNPIQQYLKQRFSRTLEGLLNLSNKVTWSKALFLLCKIDASKCRMHSLGMFQNWALKNEEIDVDVQSAVFCGAMKHEDYNNYAYLFSKLVSTKDSYLQKRYVSGLACTENKKLLNQLLEYGIKNSRIVLTSAVETMYQSSQIGLETVLEFFAQNFNIVSTMFEHEGRNLIEDVAKHVSTKAQLQLMEKIVPTSRNTKSLGNAIAIARSNVVA